ncbi:MAG TPA: alpha-hydroxy acid oxidase [Opitutaceae bacterium]|nr:alpha-hydroxy acid oxidase [Opitutaceae bacterium]
MSAHTPEPSRDAEPPHRAAPLWIPFPNAAELFDLSDFERAARQQLTEMAWNYIAGGAADELSLRWNVEAYHRIRLCPRALVDVSSLDTTVMLLGRTHPSPIILAPVAYQQLFHPEGEVAAARGAAAAGSTFVVSTSATKSVEQVAAGSTGPRWFQLYVQRDRGFTAELVHRAEAAGCEALVLTIDSPLLGPRYRELRTHFALPPGITRAHQTGLAATGSHRPSETNIYSAILDPKVTWKDIDWLVSLTRLPVLLKGLLNPEDADRAAHTGAAAVIVSNHGGRNLDTVPATIDVLPEIVARLRGRKPVLVDGGIRRGTDILKAIALGATAVMVGRPYVYGLAVQGAEGVARVVTILRRELEMALALAGRRSLKELDASVIWQ